MLAARLGLGFRTDKDRDAVFLQARAALTWFVHPHLAFDATVATSLTGDYHPHVYSRQEFARYLLGYISTLFWARWEFLKTGRLRPALGMGIGPLYIYTNSLRRGDTDPRFNSFVLTELALTGQLAIGLTPRIWIRAAIDVSFAFPQRNGTYPSDPMRFHPTVAHERISLAI
ncbi:MAG: hypothetical protein ACK2U9_05330, partial [Anaerolineae bacterium]